MSSKELQALKAKKEAAKPSDIDKILARVRYFLKHLNELLVKQIDPVKKAQFFGLIFKALPTYADLCGRNQNSPLFTGVNPLFQAIAGNNFPMVTLSHSFYRDVAAEIMRWNEILNGLKNFSR